LTLPSRSSEGFFFQPANLKHEKIWELGSKSDFNPGRKSDPSGFNGLLPVMRLFNVFLDFGCADFIGGFIIFSTIFV
jgi:hypothetical protein